MTQQVQNILLIDNDQQFFIGLDLEQQLLTACGQENRILATATMASALNIMEAFDIDLVVLAGNQADTFFADEVAELQWLYPGILIILIIDDQAVSMDSNPSQATADCHTCLRVSIGPEALTRYIYAEAEKMRLENQRIARMLATGSRLRVRSELHQEACLTT